MEFPSDLKYSMTHEWLRIKGTKGTLGISDFAQSELGDIVYVEFPEVGDEFIAGDEIAMIDSAKTTAQIYTPVSGKVIEVNEKLNETPELVNSAPYGAGYLFVLEITDASEADEMLDHVAYADFVESGGGH